MKHGKRYNKASELLEKNKTYSLSEAVELVKKTATAKFDETIDISVKLGVDPKHADQMVRSTVVLPYGTGKSIKVAVIAKGEKEKDAKDAGADLVGSAEIIEEIQKGNINFDVLITTPDMMRDLSKLGKILGPKGLMPNPKAGTVTFEVAQAVRDAKRGKVEFRVDDGGVIHLGIGKKSFRAQNLLENLNMFFETVFKVKPSSAKGQYLLGAHLSASMGPDIPLNVNEIMNTYR
ncbi:MAG: 50S ribosomal protein L1 [Candidatus Firestonebacteria bacterium]|nr:50S ribosomal protein L1 [Candidatus Firestonebacteria bacterium]